MFKNRRFLLSAGIEVFLICLWGGIYDFTAALYGTIFASALVFTSWKRGKLFIPGGIETVGLGIMLAGYILSACLARDKGVAFVGVIRFASVCLFWILWNNLEDSLRERLRGWLPRIAAALTGAAVVLYISPYFRELLFRAGRLGGVFQYSNTYALFLLIGIVITVFREKKSRLDYLMTGVLSAGIVLCGSRSVLVLFALVLLLIFIRRKLERKWIVLITGIVICVCLVLQLILQLDLERLFQMTLDSSTLNGRLLYWTDAVPVILEHPLGLGYMGYYFLQPQFQTGVYVTRFVHNDLLQWGLDAGIIPMVVFVGIIFANIFNRENTKQNRIILILIFLHCMFDFDLQYICMFCIMLMCMKAGSKHSIEMSRKTVICAAGGAAAFCAYFSLALGLSFTGMEEQALALYPADTFSREALMREKEDEEQARVIIEENGMLAAAYDCSARKYLEEGKYTEAYEDVRGILQCAGYDMDLYDQSVYYLSVALDQAVRNNDRENAQKILEQIQAVPDLLEDLESKTSFFAYRINDRPEFELEESIEDYIQSMKDISL